MTSSGYVNLSLRATARPDLEKLIILLSSQQGRRLTLSEAITVALKLLESGLYATLGCRNTWHNTAPARAFQRCPECPSRVADDATRKV